MNSDSLVKCLGYFVMVVFVIYFVGMVFKQNTDFLRDSLQSVMPIQEGLSSEDTNKKNIKKVLDSGEGLIKEFNASGGDLKTYKNELLDCINSRREAMIKNFFVNSLTKVTIPRTSEGMAFDVQMNSCLELYDRLEEYVEEN